MLEFAKLCDYLTPTTLAAIIADVDDAMAMAARTTWTWRRCGKLACDALNANVGEDEAARLIEKLRS